MLPLVCAAAILPACGSAKTASSASGTPWAKGRTEPLPLASGEFASPADRWRPAWWHDGVVRDDATVTVWVMAEGLDLSSARAKALAAAGATFQQETGRKPVDPSTTADSTLLSSGRFRAFVRLQATPS